MIIRDKKLRNRDRIIFIFEFDSEEDVKNYFEWLDIIVGELKEEYPAISDDVKEFAEKLRSRLDDKYASDRVYKSAMLFQDEMCNYSNILMIACECILILKAKYSH